MEHNPIRPASAPQEAIERFLGANIPVEQLSSIVGALGRFSGGEIGTTIEVLIALLDLADGDYDAEVDDRGGETIPVIDNPDVPPGEDAGDPDLEETGAEDSFGGFANPPTGAGCPISDPGGAAELEDDEEDDPSGQCDEDGVNTSEWAACGGGPGCTISDQGEVSVTEWHTRGRYKLSPGLFGKNGWMLHEDDELNGDETDIDFAEDDFGVKGRGFFTDGGAGCPISDPDYACDDVRCDDLGEDLEQEQMHDDVPMPRVLSLDHNVFTDERVSVGISNLMTSFIGVGVVSADSGAVHTSWPHRPSDKRRPGVPI